MGNICWTFTNIIKIIFEGFKFIMIKIMNILENKINISHKDIISFLLKCNMYSLINVFIFIFLKYKTNKHQNYIDYVENSANFYLNTGFPTKAKNIYFLLSKRTKKKQHEDMYLQSSLLCPKETTQTLYKKFKKHSPEPLNLKFESKPRKKKNKIRVGFTSCFFSNPNSMGSRLLIIEKLNRQFFEVYTYFDGIYENADNEFERLKEVSDKAIRTEKLSPEEFVKTVREDDIDILVEMNGYIHHNRLKEIATRCAPIQINWGNHCSTTGIREMDYNIVPYGIIEPHKNKFFTEENYNSPCIFTLKVFDEKIFPAIQESPCIKNKFITFSNFGAVHKLNKDIIKLWSKVVNKVPNSIFLYQGHVLNNESFKEKVNELFLSCGFKEGQFVLNGYSPYDELLKKYNCVDIALDTFPATGGATMMESLYMGVPMFTLRGERWISRNGSVILEASKLKELIANDEEQYLQKIVHLANDKEKLLHYRRTIRSKILESQINNSHFFVEEMGNAFQEMYNHCKKLEDNKYAA